MQIKIKLVGSHRRRRLHLAVDSNGLTMMTMIVMTTPPSIGHLTGVTNKAIENRLSPARDNIPKKESIHTHAARRGGERAHSEEGTAPHVAHLGWRRHDLLWGLLVGTVQVDPQHEDPVFTAVAVVVREAALDARVRLAASEQPHGHRLAAQHTGACVARDAPKLFHTNVSHIWTSCLKTKRFLLFE